MSKFAHIHDTPKGQILLTKEYEPTKEVYNITIWFNLEEIALAKAIITVEDELSAEKTFENLHDFSILKVNLNMILNQDYL